MTPYFVHGVQLVNTGGERCECCERPAVGRSISGSLLCATHAGWASELAEEYAKEVEASKARTRERRDADLARCRRLIATPEGVAGDDTRRARGSVKGGRARRNNTADPVSDRREYDRQYYLANRELKIVKVKAGQKLAKIRRARRGE